MIFLHHYQGVLAVFKTKKTLNTTILNYNVQSINKSTPKTYFFNKVNTPIDLGYLKVVEISITFLTI
jgi:hypothetical protein